jgi:hypothetical protein
MPTLHVGDTAIPYEVRTSTRAIRKRIVVTPDGIVVVAPADCPMEGPDGVEAFVQAKRRWLFDATREITEKHRKLLTQHYASGAKIQYRGRWLMLDVRPDDVDAVEIACRSKFHVRVPRVLEGVGRLSAVRVAFDSWLKDRAGADLQRFLRRHEAGLGVRSAGARLAEQKHSWGTCGKDRVVRIDWRLIQAPAAAMEYVVAHEVAHLIHRTHSPEFWATLGQTMPDWAERKLMLERWEGEHRAV